jgi:excisionase family DNA binding protein
MSNVMTVKQAVNNYFKNTISEWSLYEAIKRKELPAAHIGRRVLLRRESLDRWMADQEAKSMAIETGLLCGKIRRVQ